MTPEEKIEKALKYSYMVVDGDHHKMRVIDQMIRALTGDDYGKFIAELNYGEDGPDTYTWDTGVAP